MHRLADVDDGKMYFRPELTKRTMYQTDYKGLQPVGTDPYCLFQWRKAHRVCLSTWYRDEPAIRKDLTRPCPDHWSKMKTRAVLGIEREKQLKRNANAPFDRNVGLEDAVSHLPKHVDSYGCLTDNKNAVHLNEQKEPLPSSLKVNESTSSLPRTPDSHADDSRTPEAEECRAAADPSPSVDDGGTYDKTEEHQVDYHAGPVYEKHHMNRYRSALPPRPKVPIINQGPNSAYYFKALDHFRYWPMGLGSPKTNNKCLGIGDVTLPLPAAIGKVQKRYDSFRYRVE